MRSDYKETPSPQPEVVRKTTTTTTTRKTTKQITAKTPKIKVQVGNTMKLKRNFFKIFLFQIIYSFTNLLFFSFLSFHSYKIFCLPKHSITNVLFSFWNFILFSQNSSSFSICFWHLPFYHLLLYCVLSSSPLFALP